MWGIPSHAPPVYNRWKSQSEWYLQWKSRSGLALESVRSCWVNAQTETTVTYASGYHLYGRDSFSILKRSKSENSLMITCKYPQVWISVRFSVFYFLGRLLAYVIAVSLCTLPRCTDVPPLVPWCPCPFLGNLPITCSVGPRRGCNVGGCVERAWTSGLPRPECVAVDCIAFQWCAWRFGESSVKVSSLRWRYSKHNLLLAD